jgi:hypothetical protein
LIYFNFLVDPEAVKQAELMEKRREEERLRIEAMDSKFGFKKSVGFSPVQEPEPRVRFFFVS